MQKFIIKNHIPINPTSIKQHSEQTNLVKRVVMLILPVSSVDNHNCTNNRATRISGAIIIKTTNNQPCTDEISLQNTSSEATSSPSAIHNYVKEHITFYLCNINSASYAAKNHLLINVSNIMYGLY